MLCLSPNAAQSGQWQEFSGIEDITSIATLAHVFSGGSSLDGIPAL
jgi:hypothetical protein